jgi:hypothetical protein
LEFEFEFGVQRHFQQYFSYIMATRFSGGGSRSTRRKLPTLSKQLVNFITCGCNHDDPLSCLMLINLHIHATRGTGDMWTYRCTKESSSGFCPKLMTIRSGISFVLPCVVLFVMVENVI